MALQDIVKAQTVREVPERERRAYRNLDDYKISCALNELSDLDVGNLFHARELPPNTPLFRGTDKDRYDSKTGELWWTFSLRKAANYAGKNKSPLVLVGSLGDLSGFKKVDYLDQSIFIASQELYRGTFGIVPVFKNGEGKGITSSLVILSHFEELH